MANHVDNYIQLVQTNEAGQKVWNGIIQKLEKIREGEACTHEAHLGLMFWDDYEAEGFDRSGMCEKVGAKWAYATDWDMDFINAYSAWGPIGEFCEWIAEQIGAVDPDVRLSLEYRDEMPNFAGIAHYTPEGENENYEIDYDEIRQLCIEQSEELQEIWSEEDQDWKEEKEEDAWDLMLEMQWDVIAEWMEQWK